MNILIYVLGFFGATIVDTSLIWLISAVTLALMAIPNLIALILLGPLVFKISKEYFASRGQ